MDNKIINSSSLSNLIYLPKNNEPNSSLIESLSENGLFIGNSLTFSAPTLLNFNYLMNPHILIIGMTGSGKTFLMRNLILRLLILDESKVILVDFTGEYEKSLGMPLKTPHSTKPEDYGDNELTYFNLVNLPESKKIELSSQIMTNSIEMMRSRGTEAKKRVFIVLDEAWKLLNCDNRLETIIREGRKYGVGLILASQLIDDADNTVLSNIATMFLFRTQSKQSLDRIAKNYGLTDEHLSKVQNLDIGSCLTVQIYKSSERSAFIIKKIAGLNFRDQFNVEISDNMGIDIAVVELEKMYARLCAGNTTNFMRDVTANSKTSLKELISNLIANGAGAKEILFELRKLGFSDDDISDSFAYALNNIGAKNETK